METMRNDNSRFPFTSSQWQELEHQALVYKYMISGMPIPPDLLFSIQRSLDSSTKLFLHHHSPHQSIGVGWNCFQMGFGRKIDPEPGRCRRTDGKKWRCSKEAYPDSKYCERHMHRGRNRSRKPVELTNSATPNNNTPPPLSISTKPMNYPSSSSSSFLYPQLSSSSSSRPPGNVQSSQDRFWLESSSSHYSEKDNNNSNRYGMNMKEEGDEHALMGGDTWHLEPLSINTSSSSSQSSSLLIQSKHRSYSDYNHQNNGYSYLQLQNTPKRHINDYHQQLALNMETKNDEQQQPQKVTHHFFDESPHNHKDSSTTQLSISIPTGARDFFHTHNDK